MEELMETTPDDPLAMLHPSGKFVVPIMHWKARQKKPEIAQPEPEIRHFLKNIRWTWWLKIFFFFLSQFLLVEGVALLFIKPIPFIPIRLNASFVLSALVGSSVSLPFTSFSQSKSAIRIHLNYCLERLEKQLFSC